MNDFASTALALVIPNNLLTNRLVVVIVCAPAVAFNLQYCYAMAIINIL